MNLTFNFTEGFWVRHKYTETTKSFNSNDANSKKILAKYNFMNKFYKNAKVGDISKNEKGDQFKKIVTEYGNSAIEKTSVKNGQSVIINYEFCGKNKGNKYFSKMKDKYFSKIKNTYFSKIKNNGTKRVKVILHKNQKGEIVSIIKIVTQLIETSHLNTYIAVVAGLVTSLAALCFLNKKNHK